MVREEHFKAPNYFNAMHKYVTPEIAEFRHINKLFLFFIH